MTPDALAALHERAMVFASPWTAPAFAGTLASPGVFIATEPPSSGGGDAGNGPGHRDAGILDGFVVGRVVAGEAELLTLAVDPPRQGRGIGRALLAAFEAEAALRGAADAFLEVAGDNAAAISLYLATGWTEAGRRPGYYPRPGGETANALILRKTLSLE